MGYSTKKAFTLAEVLITIGVIGIVAAMTIPSLLKSFEEQQYKTAYKKAYSDILQAFRKVQSENGFVAINSDFDNMKINFDLLKSEFKVMKSCTNSIDDGCWIDSCSVDADCWSTTPPYKQSLAMGFVDSSGRAWVYYSLGSITYPLWLIVDTNGNKLPNRLGRDRFAFKFMDDDNTQYGVPTRLVIPDDVNEPAPNSCSLGKCLYKSWLMK